MQTDRLTSDQQEFWKSHGYLILPSFFERSEVEAVNALIDRRISEPASFGNATVDPLVGEYKGKRLLAREAPREAFQGPIKINDLFLDEPEVRNLALSGPLTRILSQLLGGPPMVCNSLNFICGSGQPDHVDSWFMPAPVKGQTFVDRMKRRFLPPDPDRPPPFNPRLAVSSICLEDVHPHAGPLAYYPGSHKIPPYRFSHGGYAALAEKTRTATDYVHAEIQRAGYPREEFLGKAGDVFLWHGQIVHGGSAIKDPARTRKTLVTHYWRAADADPSRVIQAHATAYYERRAHQEPADLRRK